MSSKLYVGNLSFDTTDSDLNELFAQAGSVKEAIVVSDRETGRSRGFGFVTMSDSDGATAATSKFNGHSFQGRNLTVNEARDREAGAPSGGSRGGGGGKRY